MIEICLCCRLSASSRAGPFRLPTCYFFFNDTATTEIYTLSLHDALPISVPRALGGLRRPDERRTRRDRRRRSEEHTSELQSRPHLVCRLLLEKKKTWGYSCTAAGACARPP